LALCAVLALCLLMLAILSCSGGGKMKEGNLAPDFELTSLDGTSVTLSQFRGKVVILDFWATWCQPCKLELPHFSELQRELGAQGLQIIGISLDQGGRSEVASFVRESKIPYIIVMGNGKVMRDFGGIRGIPTTFVIDKQGSIYRKYVGYREKEVFENDVRALLQRT